MTYKILQGSILDVEEKLNKNLDYDIVQVLNRNLGELIIILKKIPEPVKSVEKVEVVVPEKKGFFKRLFG